MCAAMTIFAGAVGWLGKTSRNRAGFSGDVSRKPGGRGPVAAPPGPPCCREARVKPPQKDVNRGGCTTLQPLVLAPEPRVGRPASARTGERANGRARATLRRSALKGSGKYFDPRRAPTLK